MAPTYVDMISDIFTKPTQAMKEAMINADVGEATVLALEEQCAKLLGKERALFVSTGTMGNLISIMCHCPERDSEIILGDQSHISLYEQCHVTQIAGVFPRTIPNLKDGTFDLTTLAETISTGEKTNVCKTKVICLENTFGGKILPLDYLQKLYNLAQENDVKVHVDGARILGASIGLGVPVSELAKFCDSLTLCLNKGIGAPYGSILAGSESFIKRAIRCRKALGGEMVQLGMLAAAAIYGLDRAPETIARDHVHAKKLVNGLQNISYSGVTVDTPEEVQTNIVFIRIGKERSFTSKLAKRFMMTTDAELKELGKEIHVGCNILGKDIRFVIDCDVSEGDIDDAIKKLCYVFSENNL